MPVKHHQIYKKSHDWCLPPVNVEKQKKVNDCDSCSITLVFTWMGAT